MGADLEGGGGGAVRTEGVDCDGIIERVGFECSGGVEIGGS
jgi:hypothetical protein